MFQNFLKGLGKVFVKIGSGALQTALYISAHPEVVQAAAQVAVAVGAPAPKVSQIGTDVLLGAATTAQTAGVVDAVKSGDAASAVAGAVAAAQTGRATVDAIKGTK